MLGCWGVGVLGCWGVGVLGCWGVEVLGCWGVGVLGLKGFGLVGLPVLWFWAYSASRVYGFGFSGSVGLLVLGFRV